MLAILFQQQSEDNVLSLSNELYPYAVKNVRDFNILPRPYTCTYELTYCIINKVTYEPINRCIKTV